MNKTIKGVDYEDGRCVGVMVSGITGEQAPVYFERVRHGRWKKSEDDYSCLNIIRCSVCGEEWCFEVDDDVKDMNYNYCPNCGAKMDGEDE